MAYWTDPLTPSPLSPKGARGELILLPSPPWGRGWLDEAFSSAEARRVRGSTLRWDTTLEQFAHWCWLHGPWRHFPPAPSPRRMEIIISSRKFRSAGKDFGTTSFAIVT